MFSRKLLSNGISLAGLCLSCLLFSITSYGGNQYFKAMGVKAIDSNITVEDFILPNRNGEPQGFSQWRGKLVLINFWATWCSPCLTEMPELNKLYHQYKDRGFALLAINTDSEQKKRIETIANKLALDFPILLDEEDQVSRQFGVSGMPATYLVDENGRLIGYIAGARAWHSNDAQRLIESLLPTASQ